MDLLIGAILIGIPLAWLIALAAYVYRDAPRHGMNRKKWAVITLVVPLFGFFAYVFEREERSYDPTEDPYANGSYNIHERRQDDSTIDPGRDDSDDPGQS